MKSFLRYALVALGLCLLSLPANAAMCFWVGGTASWDSVNLASWASGSGGTPSTCAATGGIPKNAGDIATFDGSSGGGTVTVCGALTTTCPTSSGTLSLGSINSGAFTGTLDFSAINPNVNLSGHFASTGTGTRTINMGSGTFTLSLLQNDNAIDFTTPTNLTLSAASSTITVSSASSGNRGIAAGGKTFGTINIADTNASNGGKFTVNILGNATIATLNLTAPLKISGLASPTITITNSISWLGTSSANVIAVASGDNNNTNPITISSANNESIAWAYLRGLAFTGGGTFTATNSFDGGGNSGITITGPSGGGGGGSHCIGC